MYKRFIKKELLDLMKGYPIVTVLGPRQSGKTTLVKDAFPNMPYINLESLDQKQLAIEDPKGFLKHFPEGVILDEVQNAPQLLSYLQVIVDEKNKNGLYVLTGSHQLQVHKAITQSLAGRTALLTLLPLSLQELENADIHLNMEKAILMGGYPRIHVQNLDPSKAYANYIKTYLERDLRDLIHIKDLTQFQRFLKICAGRIGQLINYESISNDIGVSANTIKHWISILEASYIIFKLEPFFENFGKRFIKSPKIYFMDVGLAAYLLKIENIDQLTRDPLKGNLFENLVILELIKARYNKGLDPNLYFYRDVSGNEIDVIYQLGNNLIPIEIKSAMTFNSSFLKNITFFKELAQERIEKSYLIFSGDMESQIHSTKLINFKNTSQIV